MKRWSYAEKDHVEVPEIDGFLREIDAVCKAHGMSIAHEDEHGNFIIRPYAPWIQDWLEGASYDPRRT